MQSSLTSQHENTPPRVTETQLREERTVSAGSSSLNKYLNHNKTTRTDQLEPVRLGRKRSTQVDGDCDTPNLQDDGVRGDVGASREENQINIVLNSQKFQHLGSQLLQEEEHAQKRTELGNDETNQADQDQQPLQPTATTPAEQENSLPKFGTEAVTTPMTLLAAGAGANQSEISQEIKTASLDIILMRELNPAASQGPIQSTPVGLLMQQEDHKLLQLYQEQTQELLRIAGASTPIQTLPLDNKDGSDVDTHEQSQQINMPELNYSDEPFLGAMVRMDNHQQSATSKWLDDQRLQLEPKLTEQSKNDILKLGGQQLSGGNRFTDESILSKQTIQGLQLGKGDNPNSQNTLFGPLQKVTTPTVDTKQQQQHDTSNHTLIRDEGSQQPEDGFLGQAVRDNQSKLILGMFDVNKSQPHSTEPSSPVRMPPRIPQPEPKKQIIRRPQPHKPAMVEKNFVGGGVGKYGVIEDSSKRAKKRNEPVFPAFFTKATPNNNRQQSLAKQELKLDQQFQHHLHQQKARGKSDVAFQRGTFCLNSQEQSIENMELMASNREELSPQLNDAATPNNSNNQGGGGQENIATTPQNKDSNIVITGKQYQPIRLQSLQAPQPQNSELTDPTVSLSQVDNISRPPSLMNHHNNYKVSYLNKPSAVFNNESSINSASLHNLGGITEGGIIVAINQDSKLSFRDYVELNQGNVSGNMTIEETTREITRDGLTSTVTEEIFLLPKPTLTTVPTTNINPPPKLQALRPKKLLQASQEQIASQPFVKKVGRTALLSNFAGDKRTKKARGLQQSLQQQSKQQQKSAPDEAASSLARARLRSLNQTTRVGCFNSRNSPSKKVQPLLAQGLNTFHGRTSSFQPDLEVSVAKAKYENGSMERRRDGAGDAATSQKTVHYGGKFHVDIRKRTPKKIKATETAEVSPKKRLSIEATSNRSPVIKPKYFATITAVKNNVHMNQQVFPGVGPGQLSGDGGSSAQGQQQISTNPVFLQTMQTTIDGKPSQFTQSAMNSKMALTGGSGQFQESGKQLFPQKEPFYGGPWIRKKTKQVEPLMAETIIKQKISPYHKKVRKGKNSIDSASPKRDQQSTSELVLGTKKEIQALESPRSLLKNGSNKFQLPELNNVNTRGKGGSLAGKKRKQISKTVLTEKGSNVDLIAVSVQEDFKEQMMGVPEKVEIDSILSPEFMTLVQQQSSEFVGKDQNSLSPFKLKEIYQDGSIENSPKQERRQVIKILDQAKWKAAIVPSDQQVSLNTNGEQMLAIELQQQPQSKVQTASTKNQKNGSKRRQKIQQATDQNDIINVLQETSLHMGSVFDNQSVANQLTQLEDGPAADKSNKDTLAISNIQPGKPEAKRTKSSFQKSKELQLQSMSSVSQRDGTKRADLMLEQTELAMQELMAREMVHYGKGSIDSTYKDDDMSNNNRMGASVIFAAEEVNQQMNSTEFSHFIKHKESIDGASTTRQDFAGQAQPGLSDAMYQTVFQDMAKTTSNGEMLLQKLLPKIQYFAPNISKKQQGFKQYPVSFHQKNSLPIPLEKLKLARHLQLRKHQFNQTAAGFEIQQKTNNFDQHRTRSLVTNKLPDNLTRNANLSLTTTRFSQHHRALSELRSFQQQLHIDQSEQSPPPLHLPQSSTRNYHMSIVQETLQVRKQPWGQKTVSPQRQRQIQERNARMEQLRLKQERLNRLQQKENSDLKSIKNSIALESGRDLSTNMGQHDGLSRNATPMEEIVKNQTTPAKQVIVNTSTGLNTAYLPSPAQAASPIAQQEIESRRFSMPQQFALQQSKRFGSVLIEKSVLPERRKYQIKGGAGADLSPSKDRKKDRGNFQKQSQNEDTPKSYKMPANFPHHNNDSQLDSMQGPESIEENKSPRMPVHSFTQNLIGVKTHSSQVPNRRRIMGDSNKQYNKGQAKHKDLVGNETVIRGKTLRIKDTNVSGFPDNLKNNQLHLSLEDSQNEMPERYENENDSIQNINQVQDLLDVVEKEVGQKKQIEESIEEHGQEIDTINNSQVAEFSAMKSQIGAGSTSDGGADRIKSPELNQKVNMGRNVLLSSAQTLEGSHNQQNGRI